MGIITLGLSGLKSNISDTPHSHISKTGVLSFDAA